MPSDELLIDSSSWIEFFRGTRIGEDVAGHLAGNTNVTLNIVMAEISCVLHRSLTGAEEIEAHLERVAMLSRLEGFTSHEAILAGKIRAEFLRERKNASYADCIQIAVARGRGAKILSKDSIFRGVPEGVYVGED